MLLVGSAKQKLPVSAAGDSAVGGLSLLGLTPPDLAATAAVKTFQRRHTHLPLARRRPRHFETFDPSRRLDSVRGPYGVTKTSVPVFTFANCRRNWPSA
jgi:hypothetical protein